MAAREERLVQNQHTFRLANERLRGMVEDRVDDPMTVPFLCECADLGCYGRIDITTSDYEAIHVLGNRYVILPGHPMVAGESFVNVEVDGYLVVEKDFEP